MKNNFSVEQSLYVKKCKKKKILITCSRILLLIVFLAIWEFVARFNIIDKFLISCPSEIVVTMFDLFAHHNFIKDIGVTTYETVIGFTISTILGSLIAISFWWNKTLQKVLDPYIVVLNALPKIALGPLIIIWVGVGMNAIITMCVLITFIITIINMTNAFNNVETDKITMLYTLGASKRQVLNKLIIPQNIGSFISVLKINVGLSFVGSIMGEYLVSQNGIGYMIDYYTNRFDLGIVMCCIIVLCILASAMYSLVALVEKKFNDNSK